MKIISRFNPVFLSWEQLFTSARAHKKWRKCQDAIKRQLSFSVGSASKENIENRNYTLFGSNTIDLFAKIQCGVCILSIFRSTVIVGSTQTCNHCCSVQFFGSGLARPKTKDFLCNLTCKVPILIFFSVRLKVFCCKSAFQYITHEFELMHSLIRSYPPPPPKKIQKAPLPIHYVNQTHRRQTLFVTELQQSVVSSCLEHLSGQAFYLVIHNAAHDWWVRIQWCIHRVSHKVNGFFASENHC